MQTTVMFIDDSRPLANVPVRLAGDDSRASATNDEGKVELDLVPGTYTFEVMLEGQWVERIVECKGASELFVVDMNRTAGDRMAKMTTVQMNLASLVGDRYTFEAVLGRGGMGIVVKAIDRMLNRPVAIKMLSEELQANEEAQQIFLVEARNLATLSHQNLVAIHDILNVEGHVLMIFEYVLGENLEDRIERDGVDQIAGLKIAIQLVRCISYLHDHDLIHRDLKPSNIIIQGDGTVKLIDFGLARSLSEIYIRGTRVRGTPAYMAPEQVMGIHLTEQTDLYQLGTTLFEMFAGELPFPTGDMAYAHVHRAPPSLHEKATSIDAELAAVVHQCMEKDPRDRPSSAREVLEKLSSIHSRLVADNGQSLNLANMSGSFATADEFFSEIETTDISGSDVEILPEADEKAFPVVPVIGIILLALLLVGLFFAQKSQLETSAEVTTAVIKPAVVSEPVQAPEPEPEPSEPEPEPIEAVAAEIADAGTDAAVDVGVAAELEPQSEQEAKPEVETAEVAKPAAKPVRKKPAKAHKTRAAAKPKPTKEPAKDGLLFESEKPAESKGFLPMN